MAGSVEKDLMTYMRTLSGVTSFVGSGASSRIYWIQGPDGKVTYPYIVYFNVAVNGARKYIGGTVAPEVLMQFSVWHTHKMNGLNLAYALYDGLTGYHGTPGDKRIDYIEAMGPRVIPDPDFDNVFQYVVDAAINYTR